MEEVFELTEGMRRNYIALQRFLKNSPTDRKRQIGGNYSKTDKRKERKRYLISLQDGKCVDCGFVFVVNENGSYPTATADHVIPYRFGSTLCNNVEFVCDGCNQKRESNRLPVILNYFGTIR